MVRSTLPSVYLLVGLMTFLHPSFLQREVVVEEILQQMPEYTTLVHIGLEPEIHAERCHALRHHTTQADQVLGKTRHNSMQT